MNQGSSLQIQEPAASAAALPGRGADARIRAAFEGQFDFVWRSLRRLGVPEAALRDASQQVWIVVGRKIDSIDDAALRSFLFGTAMRVASDTRRTIRRRKESPTLDGDVDFAVDSNRPEDLLEQKRARQLLDRALEALPEELRVVFVLFELEEMSTKEVAETLEIPMGTAASRLRRAREEFASTVKRMNAQLSGGRR